MRECKSCRSRFSRGAGIRWMIWFPRPLMKAYASAMCKQITAIKVLERRAKKPGSTNPAVITPFGVKAEVPAATRAGLRKPARTRTLSLCRVRVAFVHVRTPLLKLAKTSLARRNPVEVSR